MLAADFAVAPAAVAAVAAASAAATGQLDCSCFVSLHDSSSFWNFFPFSSGLVFCPPSA